MKRRMVKLARGDKKFRLGGERFLHGKSYQMFQTMGIRKLC
jgi:hypothetical protein